MEKLEKASTQWWFFVILLTAQSVLVPVVSRNFDPKNIQQMVYTTLSHAPQGHLGGFNILFQSLSLLMFVLLFVFKNKVRTLFNGYVALSYLAFAFIQNMAVTERYGFSVVTVNLVMFLFVAYVWIRETLNPKNTFDLSNLRWKYGAAGSTAGSNINATYQSGEPLTDVRASATNTIWWTWTAPASGSVQFNTIASEVYDTVMGIYNMFNFLNPHTVYVGIMHIPLLTISLYCTILSYRHTSKQKQTESVHPLL